MINQSGDVRRNGERPFPLSDYIVKFLTNGVLVDSGNAKFKIPEGAHLYTTKR